MVSVSAMGEADRAASLLDTLDDVLSGLEVKLAEVGGEVELGQGRHPLEDLGLFASYAEIARRSSGAPQVLLTTVGAERQNVILAVGEGAPEIGDVGAAMDSTCKFVVHEEDVVRLTNLEDLPALTNAGSLGISSYLGAPWRVNGHVLGSFCMLDSVGRTWSDVEVNLARACADQITEAIRSGRLK